MNKHFTLALLCVLTGGLFTACHKDGKDRGDGNSNSTGGGTTAVTDEDSLKYLMYHTMQVSYVDGGRSTNTNLPTYYWYSQVPQLDPVSSAYSTADTLLEVMKRYSTGPGSSTPLDRYSFLDRTGDVSSQLQDGVSELGKKISGSGSLGLEVTYAYRDESETTTDLYVLYADKNSPAGKQGITRGYKIIAINGDSNIQYDGPNGTNSNKVYNAIYNSSSTTLQLQNTTNNATRNVTLTAGTYNINPVLFDTTYTVGGDKVGYFVFYTFTSTYNTNGAATLTKSTLDALLTKFKSQNITHLIVDLRYNGGGSVTTAEYLDSALAPAAAASQPMYYYKYNDKLTANMDEVGLEAQVNFPAATGGFNLKNIFFIVSRSTASASELTMNNLRPYYNTNIKLIGDTTYGKPVGFITFTLNDFDSTHTSHYLGDLYAINFATENAAHEGGYFTGIAPDKDEADYIDVPWGDNNYDANLADIFQYIKGGSFPNGRIAARDGGVARAAIKPATKIHRFNGMVDYRIGKKLQLKMK